jgi:hypothetical protein
MLHSKAFAARGTFGGHRRTRSAVKQAVCHKVMLQRERLKQAAAMRRWRFVNDSKKARIAAENAGASAPTHSGLSSTGTIRREQHATIAACKYGPKRSPARSLRVEKKNCGSIRAIPTTGYWRDVAKPVRSPLAGERRLMRLGRFC